METCNGENIDQEYLLQADFAGHILVPGSRKVLKLEAVGTFGRWSAMAAHIRELS